MPLSSSWVHSHSSASPSLLLTTCSLSFPARNSDLWSFMDSMKQMEDRFNWWAGYDYVFLNDEPFDDAFKEHTQRLTNAKCHYGVIENDHWNQPDWIDEDKATAAREVTTFSRDSFPFG